MLTHIMKVQLEIASNKKVIAKKPLTDLYEMNSNLTDDLLELENQISVANTFCSLHTRNRRCMI